jgi:hypothetical protein
MFRLGDAEMIMKPLGATVNSGSKRFLTPFEHCALRNFGSRTKIVPLKLCLFLQN